jgi:hypothetical protein
MWTGAGCTGTLTGGGGDHGKCPGDDPSGGDHGKCPGDDPSGGDHGKCPGDDPSGGEPGRFRGRGFIGAGGTM